MDISEKIKTRREYLKLSLQDVASYVGVAKSTIQYWETGKTKTLKLHHIHSLARILKVDPQSLIYDDEPIAPISISSSIDFNALEDLDRELCKLVIDLPFKEKIKLYNKLSEEKK